MLDKNIIPESTSEVCVRGPPQLAQLKFGVGGQKILNIFCACDGPAYFVWRGPSNATKRGLIEFFSVQLGLRQTPVTNKYLGAIQILRNTLHGLTF